MHSIEQAIQALRNGRFVMIHDDKGRENEIDLVIGAEYIGPDHIADMRTYAGGLICLAISNEVATRLGLVYMHSMMEQLSGISPILSKLIQGKSPYGDRPSFSISINHRNTFTGITDIDRALTISKMAEVCKSINLDGIEKFASNFRSPGHVPLLIASKGLLRERMGHTELCIYLTQLAEITPAVAVCEMMDSTTHRALSIEKAELYSRKFNAPILEASQLRTHANIV